MPFESYLTNELRKQHLNLSSYAWFIIENDILNFCLPSEKSEISHFINKVYKNYNELLLFPTNINETLCQKYNFYKSSIIKNTNSSTDIAEITAKNMVSKDIEHIQARISHYSKGEGKKIYLHLETVNSLCSISENNYIEKLFKKPGKYLKSIFEEYCILPYIEREKIYFYDYILAIEDSIRLNYALSILTNNTEYEIIPYKIVTDTFNTYHYLAGYIYGKDKNIHPVSFRISRISNIKIIRTHKKLTSVQEKELSDMIIKRGAQFLVKDLAIIKIKFTEAGIKKYNSQLYLRPKYKEILGNNIYIFEITEFQAESYFFKFGKDAEILSPDNIRNNFIQKYREALNIYV